MVYQEGNPDITKRSMTLRGGKHLGGVPKPLYVAIVNDEHYYSIRQIVRSASAAGTIFAVPNDPKRQFYVDGVLVTAAEDPSAGGSTEVTVSATIDGVAQVIASCAVGIDAVTSHSEAVAFTLATPLRIDNNTNIDLAGTSTVLRGIIYGHFEYV